MLFRSSAHPGKAVRLGYCMNLHAAETLDELLAGMQRITLPLRERLAPKSEFGVGMYLPAKLARELASNAAQLAKLKRFLDEHALDPFTYNAFPFGGFQSDGLKERVFEPTWWEPARREFTLDVANVAAKLAGPDARSHVSISTHTGAHSSSVASMDQNWARRKECLRAWSETCAALARLEHDGSCRVILGLEPEPRALVETYAELWWLDRHISAYIDAREQATVRRHLGVCLDTCHAAIGFEPPWSVHAQADRSCAGVAKMQFTSALSVLDPERNERGRRSLFALDEPRFLHQVTGQGDAVAARAGDIAELARAWSDPRSAWHRCTEWRCHFHVPIDIGAVEAEGLTTTRDYADRVLKSAVETHDQLWLRPELHVEIETYTWDVLPRAARGAGELVDGLEREYRHVIGELEKAGWKHAAS
jgi:sugar phosphate isomerase/epimerase